MSRTAPRVCHLTSVHSAFDTRVFGKECRTLAAAGYSVTLVVPHTADDVKDGVVIAALPLPRSRLERMTRTLERVLRRAAAVDASVYHFHDPELIPIGIGLRVRGKRVIYDIHEDVPRDLMTKEWLPESLKGVIAWAVEKVEDAAAARLSALVAATPAIGARFEKRNPATIVVSNFPILGELVPPRDTPWSSRPPAVGYVGTTAPERGLIEMIDAMALVPESLQARLELAGSFSPPHWRARMLERPGWQAVVERGQLERAGVAELLGRVRAGLVPFQPVPNFLNAAQPIKMFEYMAAGIPVIATDMPAWREMIERLGCGLLFEPRNPAALARAIEYVLTHPQEAEAMGRRGRRAVEDHYNWKVESAKLLQLYDSLAPLG